MLFSQQNFPLILTSGKLGPSVLGFGVFLVIVSGIELPGRFWTWITIPGRLSYGIYLLHGVVLLFLWPLLLGIEPILGLGIFLAVTSIVSWLLEFFIERPCNQWLLRRFLT